MGLAKIQIDLKNINCTPLKSCWRTDLVIQCCSGPFLVTEWPEIILQLKDRYAKPAIARDATDYATLTDQSGKTIEITVTGYAMQTVTLAAGTTELEQVLNQLQSFGLQGCTADSVDGQLEISTIDRGPDVSIAVGGTSDLIWGYGTAPFTFMGSGYRVKQHFYQGAERIMLMPPAGQHINHIDVDVPSGCYKIWTRVCHGNNEETSVALVNVTCTSHVCVALILPALKTCSAGVLHPAMDEIVNDPGVLIDDEQRLIAFRGLVHLARLNKQVVIDQLNYRILEAQEGGMTELEARIQAVLNLAQQLPAQCC